MTLYYTFLLALALALASVIKYARNLHHSLECQSWVVIYYRNRWILQATECLYDERHYPLRRLADCSGVNLKLACFSDSGTVSPLQENKIFKAFSEIKIK